MRMLGRFAKYVFGMVLLGSLSVVSFVTSVTCAVLVYEPIVRGNFVLALMVGSGFLLALPLTLYFVNRMFVITERTVIGGVIIKATKLSVYFIVALCFYTFEQVVRKIN